MSSTTSTGTASGTTSGGNGHIDVANVPESLRILPQWVVWQIAERNGQPTKVPFQIDGQNEAKSNDPATWDSFEFAQTRYEEGGFQGVGFVFAADGGFAGVDLDGCRNPDSGEIAPWASEIIDTLDTYSEVSPSKTGIKLFLRGKLPFDTGKNKKLTDVRAINGKKPGIEMYDHGRYFAVTGWRIGKQTEPQPRQDGLNWLSHRYFSNKDNGNKSNADSTANRGTLIERCWSYVQKMPDAISGQGGHNSTFAAACECFRFGLTDGEAEEILRHYNGSKTGGEQWDNSELSHKLGDARNAITAAGEFGSRVNEQRTKPAGPATRHPPIPSGTIVKALDRGGNFGDVVSDNGDSLSVHFVSKENQHATIDLPRSQLRRQDGGPLDSDQANAHAIPEPCTVRELVTAHPTLRPAVIEGLLRLGETMNVVAAPKRGKSWLVNSLALSVAAGRPWLDTFGCTSGRVLIIDGELHPEVIAHRLPAVAAAMGLDRAVLDFIDVVPLRGVGADLITLDPFIRSVEPGRYVLIILDAWYRFLPLGFSENDNAQVMALYNRIDGYTARLRSAWVNVHHASKGDQSGKTTTDVGSGAGSQSRAADTHLIIRAHEEEGVAAIEAVVRSWPPVQPLSIRWTYPLWQRDDADPRRLQGPRQQRESQRQQKLDYAKQRILGVAAMYSRGETATTIRDTAGLRDPEFKPALALLVESGDLLPIEITKTNRKKPYPGYILASLQPPQG